MLTLLLSTIGLSAPAASLTYKIDNKIGIWCSGLSGIHTFAQKDVLWAPDGYSIKSSNGYQVFSFSGERFYSLSPLPNSLPIAQKYSQKTKAPKGYDVITEEKSRSTLVYVKGPKGEKNLLHRGTSGIQSPSWMLTILYLLTYLLYLLTLGRK